MTPGDILNTLDGSDWFIGRTRFRLTDKKSDRVPGYAPEPIAPPRNPPVTRYPTDPPPGTPKTLERRWRSPSGSWEVSIGGLVVPPDTLIYADGKEYRAKVMTLCDLEEVDITATPKELLTASEFARLVQITAAIGHVTRRACKLCLAHYRDKLTEHEKRFLYSQEPKLGVILGLSDARGQSVSNLLLKSGQ